MSDATNLAELRERALAFAENSILKVPLCLDAGAKAQMDKLESAISQLEARRSKELLEAAEGKSDARLAANPVEETDALLAEARADLERQAESAKECTIILSFGRLRPKEYRDLLRKHKTGKGEYDDEAFALAVAEKTYRGAEAAFGGDLDLSWFEVADNILNFGDSDNLCAKVFRHNRQAVVVPF